MTVTPALAAAAALTLLILVLARRRISPAGEDPQVRVLGTYSPVASWILLRAVPQLRRAFAAARRRLNHPRLVTAAEILVIGLWSLWLGRKFLDFNPTVWSVGREFGVQVYGFHFWEQLWKCGVCSLWNGSFNGGWPALADPFTGFLHPLSAFAGSLAGAVNGAKVTALGSIFMAGIAQWWMGRVVGLGRWSRLWAALAAAGGGHLIGRMELGSVNLVQSTAATSLALAGALDLAFNGGRKAAIRLSLLLALAFVAGVGYLQGALLLWAPWVLLIAWDRRSGGRVPWREFALAAGLAVLIAAVFLLPFARVWPSVAKFTDPKFVTSQPLEYIPLNLIIHDWDFYLAGVPGGTDFPYLHTLYIGWPAVLLAAFGLARSRIADRRWLVFLGLGALTMFWFASGVPFRWAASAVIGIAGFRHPALMAGLAVPAILAIAGYGLDRLFEQRWPTAEVSLGLNESKAKVSFRLAYLLGIPLALSLAAADRLNQHFLETFPAERTYSAIQVLESSDLQWVASPPGEHYWVEPALAAGLKLTNAVTPFWWAGRGFPPPSLEALRNPPPTDAAPVAYLDDVPVYAHPEARYAYVDGPSGQTACTAQGSGGDLTVACDSAGGRLVVYENAWAGWTATVNGRPAELVEAPWLTLDLPPGPATVRLRFRPVDALAGILLSLCGIAVAAWLWLRESRRLHRAAAMPPGTGAALPAAGGQPSATVPTPPASPTRRSVRRAPRR